VSPPNTYADNLGVDDVEYFTSGGPNEIYDTMAIASSGGAGTPLGFSLTTPAISCCSPRLCAFDLPVDDVVGATLGIDHHQLVMAYWQDNPARVLGYFWAANAATPIKVWHGPFQLASGANVRIANGPDGLFLLSQDYTSTTESVPTRLSVRKWDFTTHSFGAPTILVNDTKRTSSYVTGGLAEDAATGTLYVVWQGNDAAGNPMMRLWTSNNGGVSFSAPRAIAPVNDYAEGLVRIAVTHGYGFLTFRDYKGLHLVDISPAAGAPFQPAAGVPLQPAIEQRGVGDQSSWQPTEPLAGASSNQRAATVNVGNRARGVTANGSPGHDCTQ
jgi:hypothetical protein